MYFRRHDKTTDYCVYGGSRLKTLIYLDLYRCREYVCDSSDPDLWTFGPHFVGNFLALDLMVRHWASPLQPARDARFDMPTMSMSTMSITPPFHLPPCFS